MKGFVHPSSLLLVFVFFMARLFCFVYEIDVIVVYIYMRKSEFCYIYSLFR